MSTVLETARLLLCKFSIADASFVLELVNDPDWLRYIGDRNIHNIDDAEKYIRTGPLKSYRQHGFGLYVIKLKSNSAPIGICGLLKRETLDDVDVGFALLPAYRRKGYIMEAAQAILDYGHNCLNIGRIVAVTSPDNEASINLLKKLGYRYDRMVQITADDPGSKLFVPDETH
jgi:RimJ/RimL family protein N-acetyltransferase